MREFKVSLVTSAYNAGAWLPGFFKNISDIGIAKDIELVFVNVASDDEQATMAGEFADTFPGSVILIDTVHRVGLYAAWNYAIAEARGKYIMPANVDDKMAPHLPYVLAGVLDDDDDIALAYASGWYTRNEKATWGNKCAYGRTEAQPHHHGRLLLGGYIHPHPMWRKSLHERYGILDETLISAGDYDWFLRLSANGEQFAYISEPLSLMYKTCLTLGNSQMALSAAEAMRVRARWR
jgi:glycosyltransferase involved in cell wall biosynthesis